MAGSVADIGRGPRKIWLTAFMLAFIVILLMGTLIPNDQGNVSASFGNQTYSDAYIETVALMSTGTELFTWTYDSNPYTQARLESDLLWTSISITVIINEYHFINYANTDNGVDYFRLTVSITNDDGYFNEMIGTPLTFNSDTNRGTFLFNILDITITDDSDYNINMILRLN